MRGGENGHLESDGCATTNPPPRIKHCAQSWGGGIVSVNEFEVVAKLVSAIMCSPIAQLLDAHNNFCL